MSIIEVSSREFRSKQKAYFELADKGERVVLKRGTKQAYVLVPLAIDDDDLYFTPKMLAKIDESLQQAKEGKVKTFSSVDELDKFIDSL